MIDQKLLAFYKSNAWRKKRAEILKRDNYECQLCKRRGRFTPATVVHHIKHLDKNFELGLTNSNLVSLCGACHNEVHPEKAFKINKNKKARYTHTERWK